MQLWTGGALAAIVALAALGCGFDWFGLVGTESEALTDAAATTMIEKAFSMTSGSDASRAGVLGLIMLLNFVAVGDGAQPVE